MYWKRIAELSRIGLQKNLIPNSILQFITSFFNHIGLEVNCNAPLPDYTKKYKVMLFIHGLGGSRNTYSIFKRELASHGYIVFSPDITEVLDLREDALKNWLDSRHKQMMNRYSISVNILDYIQKDENLQNLFNDQVKLDFENISIIGHSFGGTTAIYTAAHDKRITGHSILLDPWIAPLTKIPDFHLQHLQKPLLCLKAEFFGDDVNDNLLDKLFSANISKHDKLKHSFIVQLRGSVHHNQSDIIGIMPREMTIFKKFKKIDTIGLIWRANMLILMKFLEEMDCKGHNHGLDSLEYLPEDIREIVQIRQY